MDMGSSRRSMVQKRFRQTYCEGCRRKRNTYPFTGGALLANDTIRLCDDCAFKVYGNDEINRLIQLGLVRWKKRGVVIPVQGALVVSKGE
jgi:hypothetical protein